MNRKIISTIRAKFIYWLLFIICDLRTLESLVLKSCYLRSSEDNMRSRPALSNSIPTPSGFKPVLFSLHLEQYIVNKDNILASWCTGPVRASCTVIYIDYRKQNEVIQSDGDNLFIYLISRKGIVDTSKSSPSGEFRTSL